MSRRFSLSAWLAALALLVLSMMSAPARSEPVEGVRTFSCYGTRYMGSCVSTFRRGNANPHVINVAGPQTEEGRRAAEARDQRWIARCRPVVRHDRYGMPRYSYAAPGCELGQLD